MSGEIGFEEPEGFGHVGPPKSDADMVRLVAHRAREEQGVSTIA